MLVDPHDIYNIVNDANWSLNSVYIYINVHVFNCLHPKHIIKKRFHTSIKNDYINIFQTPSETAMHCNSKYAAQQTGQILTALRKGPRASSPLSI